MVPCCGPLLDSGRVCSRGPHCVYGTSLVCIRLQIRAMSRVTRTLSWVTRLLTWVNRQVMRVSQVKWPCPVFVRGQTIKVPVPCMPLGLQDTITVL